jgi:hypothetical protein
MAARTRVLVSATQVPASDTALRVQGDREFARIELAHAYNNDSVTRTLTMYVVESGGSVGAGTIYHKWDILPGDGRSLWEIEGKILPPGATLYGIATAASQVTLHIDGQIFTESP